MAKKTDAEMAEFQAAFLRSAKQAVRGVYSRLHTPTQIVGSRGLPADASGKTDKSGDRVVDDSLHQQQPAGKKSSSTTEPASTSR